MRTPAEIREAQSGLNTRAIARLISTIDQRMEKEWTGDKPLSFLVTDIPAPVRAAAKIPLTEAGYFVRQRSEGRVVVFDIHDNPFPEDWFVSGMPIASDDSDIPIERIAEDAT